MLKVDLTRLDHDTRLAFFLNVLNTLALHALIEIEKLPEGGPSWFSLSGNASYNIGGYRYTSFVLFHSVLRAQMHVPTVPFGKKTKRECV
jgi:hypothetical protein